jgi:hypothetical protein
MNPYPFCELNHFTVPRAIVSLQQIRGACITCGSPLTQLRRRHSPQARLSHKHTPNGICPKSQPDTQPLFARSKKKPRTRRGQSPCRRDTGPNRRCPTRDAIAGFRRRPQKRKSPAGGGGAAGNDPRRSLVAVVGVSHSYTSRGAGSGRSTGLAVGAPIRAARRARLPVRFPMSSDHRRSRRAAQ